MIEAPVDNLVRSAPFELTRNDHSDGQTLSGHGAVFGEWTEIDSWEGKFRERIAPGAFRRTIKNNGSRVRLQFDHGQHPLIGSMPIGKIEKLEEDDTGLYVEARLSDNWLIEPVRDAIAEGSVDGMSFRFTVIRDSWEAVDTDMPERTIQEVRLMEVGPVVWPAYAGTDVGVRAQELAHSLRSADEGTRAEVVRLLAVPETVLDTRDEEPADTGTSSDERPVTNSDPADEGTPLVPHSAHQRRVQSRLAAVLADVSEYCDAQGISRKVL